MAERRHGVLRLDPMVESRPVAPSAAQMAGPQGAAGGFARVTPSSRYTSAVAVRSNYNHWDVYNRGWYTDHPGAWFAAGWATGAAWRAASWNSVGTWMNYYPTTPVYYDYGNTISYENDNVYVNGQEAGTTQEYYQQAANAGDDRCPVTDHR